MKAFDNFDADFTILFIFIYTYIYIFIASPPRLKVGEMVCFVELSFFRKSHPTVH